MSAAIVAEPNVSSIVIIDSQGERIAARYFTDDLKTLHAQQQFEKSLLSKALKCSSQSESDILLFDGHVAVFREGKDVYLFVTGDQNENEIILVEVLNALFNAYASLLPGGSLDRHTMLEKLDIVLLALDEIVDSGVILEIEPSAIVNRVGMRGADAAPAPAGMMPLQAQTPQQALLSLKEQMTRAFKSTGGGFSGSG